VHEGLERVYREVVIAETLWSVDGYYLAEKFHAPSWLGRPFVG